MNRLYAVESTPTVTGTIADHRWALPAREIELLARELALGLDVSGLSGRSDHRHGEAHEWLDAVIRDLTAHRGSSLVVAGDCASAEVHALVHAINAQLGNVDRTVSYGDPVETGATDHRASLDELVRDMQAGTVDVLVILGGNPVYDTPVDVPFAGAMERVGLRVHQGLHHDETAERCHWHIPATHDFEGWSDARAHDGTASIVQPLIEPLYDGHSAHEMIEAMIEQSRPDDAGAPPLSPLDRVRATWQAWHAAHPGRASSPDFETFWRRALHDGLITGTAPPNRRPFLNRAAVPAATRPARRRP
jgi:molybdopterin-containing oxidoreductase family iron-sulfur binding subunit